EDAAMSDRDTPAVAADVMTPSPRTCSPFSSVLEAVLIFRDADCGAVPVTDGGRPLGIPTDRDVALALADHPDLTGVPVSQIMTKGVVTVGPDAPLDEVRQKLADHAIRRLVVVDDTGHVLGIIGMADLAPRIADRAIGQVVSEVVSPP